MNLHIEYKQLHDAYWILLPILIGAVAYIGHRKKRRILDWMDLPSVDRFGKGRTLTLALGLAMIFYALLGPQQETGIREIKGEGSDIYILMDTSKSMLAEDVIPSRMTRSKEIVKELIDGLKGDRIGFIPYASSAYIQMPLTDDYNLAQMYLDVVDTDMMGGGGTDVAQALSLAKDSFENTGADNQVILILGDGEEEDMDLEGIRKMIGDSNLTVYTIGIGTGEGGLIPLYDETGTRVTAYKKDDADELVVTQLDADTLKTIASAGGGQYYTSDNGLSEVPRLLEAISKLAKGETTTRKMKQYNQLFQWFLGAGLLLLMISFKLPKRRFEL